MEQLFSNADLDKWLDIFQENATAAIKEKLQEAGEMFVKLARESGNYQNQTGNLRSSIGYVICHNGSILEENFQKSGKGKDGATGMTKGTQLAIQISSKFKGYSLTGVAGMEYAICVEAKSFDVISGATTQTEQWLRTSIETIFKKAAQNGRRV